MAEMADWYVIRSKSVSHLIFQKSAFEIAITHAT